MPFDKNVFINCPFDEDFLPLLRPLLFTVLYLGFTPRISLESLDSGSPRIQKILSLIEESKYSIHDLSRNKAKRKGEFFRLNMPFELGIDLGCRQYASGKCNTKKFLILEAEPYNFQAAISDISNSDLGVHKDEPELVVTRVRNWLNSEENLHASGSAHIWGRFNEFMADNYNELIARGFSTRDIEQLEIAELLVCMQEWIQKSV